MHFTFWSCWFRIVSIAIAVLPVERSPMMSSRWPRPTFVIEVERKAAVAVFELEHLVRNTVLEPVDAGDAVADLQDGADFGEVGLDVELLDPFLQDRGDLFGAQLHRFVSSLRASVRGVVVRAGRARSRRASSIRPGGRVLRSGLGPPCARPAPCGPTHLRSGRGSG